MDRRKFIRQCAFAGGGALFLAGFLQSCGGIHYAASTIQANKLIVKRSEFIVPDKPPRAFVVVRNEKLPFPVALYRVGENEYNALYMQCTHQGCELEPNKVSLVCPCHGSEFSNKGEVMSPPAEKNLVQFKVTTDNENILIEI